MTATDEWIAWSDREIARIRRLQQSCVCLTCGERGVHAHWMQEAAVRAAEETRGQDEEGCVTAPAP